MVVVALNVAELRPASTVTDAGAVKVGFEFVRVASAFPAGAAFVRVRVQVVDPLGPMLVGLHASDDTNTAATRFTVALLELPL